MSKFVLKHRVRRPVVQKRGTGPLINGKHPLLILLHGMGGNEDDLFDLSQYFDPRYFIISVRAPFEQSPTSFAWYRISPFLDEQQFFVDDSEVSRQKLVQFINEVLSNYDVDPEQLYLWGYGQGATLSLSLLLTEPGLMRCIVAISGQILPEVKHLIVNDQRLREVSLFLAYGLHDQVIPVSMGRQTRDSLTSLNLDVSYREYASGHEMSPNMLYDSTSWLSLKLDEAYRSKIRMKPAVLRLGHVQIKVRDLDRSIAFYKRFLGLQLSERVGKVFAFLTSGYHHHELALQSVGPDAVDMAPNSIGLQNLAFEVVDQATLAQVFNSLDEANIPVRIANHIVSWSIYFHDPDGIEVEVFCDTRNIPGHSDYWQGRDIPLTPEELLFFLQDDE